MNPLVSKSSVLKIAGYGLVLALLILCLNAMEYRLLIVSHSAEVYAGLVAVVFSAAGVVLGIKISKSKTKEQQLRRLEDPIFELVLNGHANISKRELEILHWMALGLSNQEISDKVFLSVNTVKTHISNIFEKLGAKRRTEAVNKARELQIIP